MNTCMTRAGQTIITTLSLHRDVVERLDRVAKHMDLSRSACAERILSFRLPLLDDRLPERDAVTAGMT
jgi:predicted transcriptional regulator